MEWDDNLIKVSGNILGIILFGVLVWWSLKFEKEREKQEKEDEDEKERVNQEKLLRREYWKESIRKQRRASKSEKWRTNKKKAKTDSKEQEAGKRVFKLNPGEFFLIFIEPTFSRPRVVKAQRHLFVSSKYDEPVFFTKFNSGKTIFGEENYGIGVLGNINVHKDPYIAKWFSSYEEIIEVIISFIKNIPDYKGKTHLMKIKVRNDFGTTEIIGGGGEIIRLTEDFIDSIQERF